MKILMPQLLKFASAMANLSRRDNISIDKLLRDSMLEYKGMLSFALSRALASIALTPKKALDPASYYAHENDILSAVRDTIRNWYNNLTIVAEKVGEDAYIGIRELSIKTFEELFDIEYKRIPDENMPSFKDPDTAGALDVEFDILLPKEAKTIVVKPKITLLAGNGGLPKEYERLLRAQFDAGIDPRNAITTFSAKDIARIENAFIKGLRQGVDGAVVKDGLVGKLASKASTLAERKKIAYNMHRILRTTHQNASTAAAFMSARTNPVITGLRRHTGPRPCIACTVLAGKLYRKQQEFRDHPNGMCFVTFEIVQPSALGIDITTLSPQVRRAWETSMGEIPDERMAFLAMSDDEQKRVINNDSVFKLWKEEKFPLEKLAVYKNGSFVAASYIELMSSLTDLGGVSYPKIAFNSDILKVQFLEYIDPKDRANASLTFSQAVPAGILNKFGKDKFPSSLTDVMVDNADTTIKPRLTSLMSGYYSIGTAPWFVFNEVARVLDIGIRKTSFGSYYWVI